MDIITMLRVSIPVSSKNINKSIETRWKNDLKKIIRSIKMYSKKNELNFYSVLTVILYQGLKKIKEVRKKQKKLLTKTKK